MKLKRSLPRGRTLEQIKNHYLIERSIADKLKSSDRQQRTYIYRTMYKELFSKVPDHPRLTRRNSTKETAKKIRHKYSLVRGSFDRSSIFVEFAPGDCRFAVKVAETAKTVYGVDISDQRDPEDKMPANFKLLIYDGYKLDDIENGSVDMVFSDQLIEHLHPEDTKTHFQLVYGILKTGGKYIFRAPHALSGPHDISRYFSDTPEGFHLKEWTYGEITGMLEDINYSRIYVYWNFRGIKLRVPRGYFRLCESLVRRMPRGRSRTVIKCLIPCLCCEAVK